MIRFKDVLKELVKERVNSEVVELGLTAPKEKRYEIEHITRGSNLTHAFEQMKAWAKNNGYEIKKPDGGEESVYDYKFIKNGNIERVVDI
jgi:DNA-binding HxlR family transcriptional regulator